MTAFYEHIWNAGDLSLIPKVLAGNIVFRGSLGNKMCGWAAFAEYVKMIRTSLGNYHCQILDCIYEGDRAFCKMKFSGTHIAPFRGCPPTGKLVHWLGAALFRLENNVIAEVWVLGDLTGLDTVLRCNAAES